MTHASPYHSAARPTTAAPTSAATTAPATPPPTALTRPAPLVALPLLVLPSLRVAPLCPLLVASTLGSIVAVFAVFVTLVVENVAVIVCAASAPESASPERKTSAKPGAGTLIGHTLFVVSQDTVWMSRVPCSRPSLPNVGPNVLGSE
jgi:hypothetical protein